MLTILWLSMNVLLLFCSDKSSKAVINTIYIIKFILITLLLISILCFWHKYFLKKDVENCTQSNINIEHNLKGIIKNYISQNPDENFTFSEEEKEGNGYYYAFASTIPQLSSYDTVKSLSKDFENNKDNILQLETSIKKLGKPEFWLFLAK